MAAADFFLRSTQVPANGWLGLNDSVSVPALYAGGAVQYWVYEPSTAALASIGIGPGQPMPVMINWSTLSSSLIALGGQEGLQMTDGGKLIASKLGFGSARDGSLKLTPGGGNQTWPFLSIFPQMPNSWTPAISGASTRGGWMIHDAIMRDVLATYNIDRTRIYGTGVSGNAARLGEYCMAKFKNPTKFLVRYAAIVACSGVFSGSGWRQDFPDSIQSENSTNQTIPKLMRYVTREMDLYWLQSFSVNDDQAGPGVYNSTWDPSKQWAPPGVDPIPVGGGAYPGTLRKHGQYLLFHELTGGTAPLHVDSWDTVFGNNTIAGALNHNDWLWQWMMTKRYIPNADKFTADQSFLNLGGPAPAGGGGGISTDREFRRRRTVGGGRSD